jgi:hypothetical protein
MKSVHMLQYSESGVGAWVDQFLRPALAPFIHGSNSYITEDEHKLTQSELDLIRSELTRSRVEYFNMLSGRLFPARMAKLCRLEHMALKTVGALGRLLMGRVMIVGHMQEQLGYASVSEHRDRRLGAGIALEADAPQILSGVCRGAEVISGRPQCTSLHAS